MKVTRELAKKFLSDVDEHHRHFWAKDGTVLKNLKELPKAVRAMDDEHFEHHLNKNKNDFSNWVLHVIGDEKLAKDLLKSKNKKSVIKKVQDRVNLLKNVSKKKKTEKKKAKKKKAKKKK